MTPMSSPQPPQGSGPQGYPVPPQASQGYQPQTGAPQGHPVPPQGYQAPGQPAYGQPPQGHGAQGSAPQAQAYGGGPTGELVLNLQKPFGAMGMITPLVTIDGYTATATWGRNAFQAPAGVRRIDVAQTYLWTYGRASMTVPVEAGRSAEVFYTGPMFTFGMGGRMGTEPQKRPGTGLFIAIMVVLFLIVFLAVFAGIAAGG